MKTIQTKSGELILLKVPEDADRFSLSNLKWEDCTVIFYWTALIQKHHNGTNCFSRELISIPRGGYNIVGKFSELKDKALEEFVKMGSYTTTFWNYITNDNHKSNQFSSAKESFQSLCKSQGIEDDLSNYLIIKKL
jgi:hypothetical protein